MNMNNKKFGDFGEQVAADFLRKKGYKILDRNFRALGTELDIICMDKNILVFVEVKSRTSKKYGYAYEAITEFKINNIIQTAISYIIKYDYMHLQARFDVIEFYSDGTINHIENAFEVV